MGTCGQKVKIIKSFIQARSFEHQLFIQKSSIEEIKNSFFYKNQNKKITQKDALLGLQTLNKTQNDLTDQMLKKFCDFLSNDPQNIEFEPMILMLFLLSKSSRNQKACEIFKFFDHEAKGYLTKEEILELFASIIIPIMKLSRDVEKTFLLEEKNSHLKRDIESVILGLSDKQLKNYCSKIIRKILLANFFKSGSQISEKEFVMKIEKINLNFCYDLLTTTGIRNLFCSFMKQEISVHKISDRTQGQFVKILTDLTK